MNEIKINLDDIPNIMMRCKPAATYILYSLIIIFIFAIIQFNIMGVNKASISMIASMICVQFVCIILLYFLLIGICATSETASWLFMIISVLIGVSILASSAYTFLSGGRFDAIAFNQQLEQSTLASTIALLNGGKYDPQFINNQMAKLGIDCKINPQLMREQNIANSQTGVLPMGSPTINKNITPPEIIQ